MLQLIFYPALLCLLFAGAKFMNKGEWNDEVLSFDHTKAFLGFSSIVIIFHHASQKTCADWMDPRYIRHGLDLFVYVGYLCVAAFFFCSGYGMRSACGKKNFFQGYFKKRLLPLIVPAAFMWAVFFVSEKIRGIKIDPPLWINVYDYIWFIPAILYMYVWFYLSFHVLKKEKLRMPLLWTGVILYIILAFLFSPGTWWYNTVHLFAVGAGFAGKKEKRIEGLRRHYPLKTALFILLTLIFFISASYYPKLTMVFHRQYNERIHWLLEAPSQMISAYTFVFSMILLGMKIHIGNRLIKALGTFTLELYLLHPFFVQLFAYFFIKPGAKPVFYIKDPFLYVLAIIIPSIPLAYLGKKLLKRILS
ncbi:MAG: acyltransferase [Lachnospiraceae bacterium]|nr:acyltransferase [Lachnospiraceae bacterium]